MSHDSWFHRVVRPAVRPLVASAVTPNQITWARLGAGIAAAAALAEGGETWRHWGAALFALSFLLDRADGELARLSGKSSAFGHKLDLVSDTAANALAFAGLGLGLRTGDFGAWAPWLGVSAGLAVAGVLLLVWRLESADGERAGELGSLAGFDPDDAMLALPLLVWLGFAETLLLLASIGAPVFLVLALLKFRGRLWRERPDDGGG